MHFFWSICLNIRYKGLILQHTDTRNTQDRKIGAHKGKQHTNNKTDYYSTGNYSQTKLLFISKQRMPTRKRSFYGITYICHNSRNISITHSKHTNKTTRYKKHSLLHKICRWCATHIRYKIHKLWQSRYKRSFHVSFKFFYVPISIHDWMQCVIGLQPNDQPAKRWHATKCF